MLAGLRKPAQLTRPPRVLLTSYNNAEVVGPAHAEAAQLATLHLALRVLAEATEPGTFIEVPKA
ncbi:MAG TPA: hypothetical protein VF510_11670 [Ktedonobacterales bacterium]